MFIYSSKSLQYIEFVKAWMCHLIGIIEGLKYTQILDTGV